MGKTGFSNRIVYARDYIAEARTAKESWGRTDLYSTGITGLDDYLFGGYGNKGAWEIMVLHGSYGVGKSTVALNLVANAIRQGTKVGIMALEDDPSNVVFRLALALEDAPMTSEAINGKQVRLMPQESLQKLWTLSELILEIEKWFTDPKYGVDIIILDHLQFAFDSADMRNEQSIWAAQAVFMRELNTLMKRTNKTIILVSQENREGGVAGSIGIPRAASKMIGVSKIKNQPGKLAIALKKARNTPERDYVYVVEMVNSRILDSSEQPNVSKQKF